MWRYLCDLVETAARRIWAGRIVLSFLAILLLAVCWIMGPLFDEVTAYHYYFEIEPDRTVPRLEELRGRVKRIDESFGNLEEQRQETRRIQDQIQDAEDQIRKTKGPSGSIAYAHASEISGYFYMNCNSAYGVGKYRLKISVGNNDLFDRKSMQKLDGGIGKHIMPQQPEDIDIVEIYVARDDGAEDFSCNLYVVLFVRDMSLLTRTTRILTRILPLGVEQSSEPL